MSIEDNNHEAGESAVLPDVLVTQEYKGHIALKIGQRVVMTFTERPSTGYEWKVTFYDNTMLRLIDNEEEPIVEEELDPETIVFGGQFPVTFVFEAIQKRHSKCIAIT